MNAIKSNVAKLAKFHEKARARMTVDQKLALFAFCCIVLALSVTTL